MSIKIIYRPVSKNDSKGFLKIRIIENRKSTVKSLGIKITGKNWLDDKQRVSLAEKDANKINDKITEVLRDLSKHDTPTQALKTTNKTILTFYDEVICTTLNNGTRLKYVGIRNRFESYLNSIGLKDLKLRELNPQHVNSFHTYIRENGCGTNTANYNLKSFKAIINKAIKSGLINYTNDPFSLLQLKFTQTVNKTLTTKEVERLIKATFKDHRKKRYNNLDVSLEEFRDIFLFQLFSQGLRCSDVQLLRWSDFKLIEGMLIMEYTQYKTKKKMRLRLTLIALKMLSSRLSKINPNFKDEFEKLEYSRQRYKENLNQCLVLDKELENDKKLLKVKKAYDKLINETSTSLKEFNHSALEITIPNLKRMWEDYILKVDNEIYNLFITTIQQIENPNTFVFHFLDNQVFSNYKDGINLTPIQYNKLTGTRHYYNVILKEIAKQCNITTNLTSHVARHTYTQLLLDNNADVIAVSQSLGHSHISTTQTYISQLPNNRLLGINEVLSTTFN